MKFYLGTPANQAQAQVVIDAQMPVLVSFACVSPWMRRSILGCYSSGLLIDSGAYSELKSGITVDIGAYREFVAEWREWADACAALDDIRGDWRRGLQNCLDTPHTFPTFHDSDPVEVLDDLLALAAERGHWIGLGLLPPRHAKGRWLRETLERIPAGYHVHGWALGGYTRHRRLDSVDSTNWIRDSMKIQGCALTRHLTATEALRIVVLRYQRREPSPRHADTLPLLVRP